MSQGRNGGPTGFVIRHWGIGHRFVIRTSDFVSARSGRPLQAPQPIPSPFVNYFSGGRAVPCSGWGHPRPGTIKGPEPERKKGTAMKQRILRALFVALSGVAALPGCQHQRPRPCPPPPCGAPTAGPVVPALPPGALTAP